MDQPRFEEILNRHIFSPKEKAELLRKIAENPDRFVGIFRSTAPRLKLFQNLLQSREIRFGDAMEEVISELLAERKFVNQPKRFAISDEEEKSCDQYFSSPFTQKYYLVEQKVRDDHDSSKKVGQFNNFRDKIMYLQKLHGPSLIGAMYFIDPSLKKNRKYYMVRLKELSEQLGVPLHFFYDGELFDFLGIPEAWDFIQTALAKWQQSVPINMEFDFDSDPTESWELLQSVEIDTWYKLLANDNLWKDRLMQTLFSNGEVFRVFLHTFKEQGINTVKSGRHKIGYNERAFMLERKLATWIR